MLKPRVHELAVAVAVAVGDAALRAERCRHLAAPDGDGGAATRAGSNERMAGVVARASDMVRVAMMIRRVWCSRSEAFCCSDSALGGLGHELLESVGARWER